MKKTQSDFIKGGMMMILIQIALVAVTGFSFTSCEEEIKDKTLPAGNYITTSALQTMYVAGSESSVTYATTVLNAISSPSFTIGADGVITALSLGSGGNAFLIWDSGSGVQYKFALSGKLLNFQVKQYGANDFVTWGPTVTNNAIQYKQSIDGTSSDGVVQITLRYQRTDSQGSAYRIYNLKKQ
jgi:hypothetical protein